MPLLSVAIPAYNGEKTIVDTIYSCLSQDFSDFELLIIDDCSSDLTVQKINEIEDERIRVIRNINNLGLVGNWNKCIEESTGDYLLILHQDDWLFPFAFDRLIEILSKNQTVGLIVLKGILRNSPNSVEEQKFSRDKFYNFIPNGGEAMLALISQAVLCSSVVVKREAYTDCGHFNLAYKYSADEETWPRISRNWPIAIRRSPCVGVRAGGDHHMYSTWQRTDFWSNWIAMHQDILDSARNLNGISHAHLCQIESVIQNKIRESAKYIAKYFLANGNNKLAKKYFNYYLYDINKGRPSTKIFPFLPLSYLKKMAES